MNTNDTKIQNENIVNEEYENLIVESENLYEQDIEFDDDDKEIVEQNSKKFKEFAKKRREQRNKLQ